MLLLRIIPSLSLADRKMIDTRELITEARLKCITQRAVSKRKPGYVAGAKPDSLISGNRLCGPHLTGIVRTWLVWEPSLVSHDIHGLRPPRGQHGDPIPFSLSLSAVIRSEEWRIWIFRKKRFMYILFSPPVCRRRGRGRMVAARCRTTRGFPFKRIIDESTYEIQRCLPTWERDGKFPRKFPPAEGVTLLNEISIIL